MHIKPNQNDGDTLNPNPHPQVNDPENPGYEVTDVNVSGILVFVGGLAGFVAVFFVVCFFIGRLVNSQISKDDGPLDKWHQQYAAPKTSDGLTSNPVFEQRSSAQIVKTFPGPRLDPDDGNQSSSDLHAKEDLLLENYSQVQGMPNSVRIPIDRAIELTAERGLPLAADAKVATTVAKMVGADTPVVTAPLTNGFARSGFEQERIAEREQKLEFAKEASKEEKK